MTLSTTVSTDNRQLTRFVLSIVYPRHMQEHPEDRRRSLVFLIVEDIRVGGDYNLAMQVQALTLDALLSLDAAKKLDADHVAILQQADANPDAFGVLLITSTSVVSLVLEHPDATRARNYGAGAPVWIAPEVAYVQ